MNYSIRPATIDDYHDVLSLLDEGDAFHREALPQVFREPAGASRTEEYYADLLKDDNTVVFIATSKGKTAGLITVSVRKTQDIPILVPRTYAYIDDIIISKENRCQGIGQALMKQAQEWATGKGINHLELNVWDFNKNALRFFEKMGYTMSRHQMWRSLDEKSSE